MMKFMHETMIRDMIEIAKEIKDTEVSRLFKSMRGSSGSGSIASRSEKLTMVFPVICSTTMDIDTASMVAKAMERQATTMLNLLLTSTQVHNNTDALDYLSQFHTNIPLNNNTVDGMMDILDMAFKESTVRKGVDNIVFEKKQMEILNKDCKNINECLDNNISENAITSFKIIPSNRYGTSTVIKEADKYIDDDERRRRLYDAEMNARFKRKEHTWNRKKEDRSRKKDERDQETHDRNIGKDERDKETHRMNMGRDERDQETHRMNIGRDERDQTMHKSKMTQQGYQIANNHLDFFTRNNLLDNDVKKANELIPTTMVVKYFAKDGDTIIPISIIAGVKARIYPVESLDIMERLSTQGKNINAFNKFIRSTTREISFMRDFLFAIDQAKVDAVSQSNKGSSSKLWKVLERRGVKSKIKRRFGMSNDAAPISTLVITQEEVEYMKKEYNVDLEKSNVARKILDVYNFMAFVIVDQVNESVKFLFDTGNDIYEELSFNNLEKESTDGSYRKMVNLMTKVTK